MENERLQASLDFIKNHTRKRYVYFIKCHDFVKVGIGYDVFGRLCQMQTGCPYHLELIHYFPCPEADISERELHRKYGRHWERGEWFKLPQNEIDSLIRMELLVRPPRRAVLETVRKHSTTSPHVKAHRNGTWLIGGYWHKDAMRRITSAPLPCSVRVAGRPE